MKYSLPILCFILLQTNTLILAQTNIDKQLSTLQSLAGKVEVTLIQPNEKRSTTQNQNYNIELHISKIKDLKKISFTHNKRPFKYNFNPRTGRINANIQLHSGSNVFTLKVKRKTHQFLITYQPTDGNFKPASPRPNLSQKPKPTSLDDLEQEVHTFSTSKSYFPIETKLKGINSRQQILLAHNKKHIKNYSFKKDALKAKIQLTKGVNDIVLAVENEKGVDITRWKITYTPDSPSPTKSNSDNEYSFRKKVVNYAQKFKGTHYHYGGESPRGFDCSGFTQYVMEKHDINIPRVSYDQARKGKKVKQRKAQAGDLVFFAKNGKQVSHVSLVLLSSSRQLLVVHSTSSQGVIIEDIMQSDYWQPKMLYIRDVISSKH